MGEVTLPVFLALDDKNSAHSMSLQCSDLAGATDQQLKAAAGLMITGVHGDSKTRRELRDEIHTTLRTAQNICKPE